MNNLGGGKRLSSPQGVESLPVQRLLAAASIEPVFPRTLRVVAYRAHRGQMRKSGEPFIIHPVEVALLLSGMKMDSETVMAGLLHDTGEDTDLTFAIASLEVAKADRMARTWKPVR